MKKKKIFIICIFAAAVIFIFFNRINRNKTGIPDKTGSWSHINQEVQRSKNWNQYVQSSQFQLGERRVKGSWNTPDGPEDYYEIEFGTYPSLDGSTVAIPMAVEFARQHLKFTDEDANDFSSFTTTHYAYENLILKQPNTLGMIRTSNTFVEENHPVDLIIATEPSDEEINLAKDKNVELIIEPVCYDAFVFITHKDNVVDNLTIEQIQKIYSGEITNWQEVGGKNQSIKAFQREKNSGSQTAMENLVMKGIPMLPPNIVKVAAGMGMLVDAVGEYENSQASIGYTYKYYIDTLYKNENIKVLKVEGVSPDDENLRNKSYSFTTNYYGVIRKEDEQNIAGKFLEWMISQEGQKCIEQAGYIPLNMAY
ncbi:substrate-binding domain-containing protein [Sedimentibacter sp.]|uniref:PstS family phosphate ABC transporter substrate-binding protein n=1 Tax=Sedimentibacter sp. TaxID=1960295 RepID=UPI0028A7E545|nr:substrate-binding domain-containing protein [Sedimentibacter sp.]